MHGRETWAAFLIQCSGVGQRRVSVPADTVEVQRAPGLMRLLLAGTQKPAPGTQEREAAREGQPGPEVPGFYHTRMARSELCPGPPQNCGELPGGLESSSWLMDMQGGGVILLGQGASGDSKGGDKDHSTNSMKLQRLSQSKKLHQAKLENFQQKIRDLCFNKGNY